MPHSVSDEQLERYIAKALSPAARRRVEAALRGSPALQERLDELKREAELLDAVKDSQTIQPSEQEEKHIVGRVARQLGTTLDGPSDRTEGRRLPTGETS